MSGRPARGVERQRFIVKLPVDMAEQVRELSASERRPLNTQIELLIERGLRSYGMEVAAA